MNSSSPVSRAVRGRALVTLLLALAGAVALLAWASDLSAPRASKPAAKSARTADPAPPLRGDELGLRLVQPELAADERGGSHGAARPVAFEKSFRGRGNLTVVVDVPPGVEFPAYWELRLEPARFLAGEEHAIPRTLVFERGDHEIVERAGRETVEVSLEDVPFGGYAVVVDAVDMNATGQEVVLYAVAGRPDLPGRKTVRTMVRLTPAGFLDGSLVDEDGRPVEGCPVHLTDSARDQVQSVRSGPNGVYVFPSVRDGRYELVVGDPEQPYATRTIELAGRETNVEEILVPRTASVVFLVTDVLNMTVPNVLIEGYGKSGTSISVRTDLDGLARVPFLPAGEYRVRLSHPTGRRGKMDFSLQGDERDHIVEVVVKQ